MPFYYYKLCNFQPFIQFTKRILLTSTIYVLKFILAPKYVTEMTDSILARVCALHRPLQEWKHESFMIAAQIYHGTRPVGQPVLSQPSSITEYWYPVINFNYWFDIDGVQFNALARESRLVLVLYGRTLQTDNGGDNNSSGQYTQEELGWGAVQFFNYDGYLLLLLLQFYYHFFIFM